MILQVLVPTLAAGFLLDTVNDAKKLSSQPRSHKHADVLRTLPLLKIAARLPVRETDSAEQRRRNDDKMTKRSAVLPKSLCFGMGALDK